MKLKTKFNLKVWLIAMVLIIPMVVTQTSIGRESSSRFIQHFDRDQDGRISADEFPGPQDHFTQLDENSDGYIDETEASKKRPPHLGKRNRGFLKRFDTDSDGKVSKTEFTGSSASRFDRLDKNGDGYIDETEAPKGPPRGRHNR